jgi:hypothetical protein
MNAFVMPRLQDDAHYPYFAITFRIWQLIEKTKGLSFRSYVLAQNMEKRSAQPTSATADV